MSDLVCVAEAAKRLAVDRTTVYRMVKKGEIPSYRIGHAVRLDLNELRESFRVPAGTEAQELTA